MCWRLRHPTSPPGLPPSTNTAGQPTTTGTRSLRERRAGAEPSGLDLPHPIRTDLPRLVGGEVPRATRPNSRLPDSPLHAGELTDEFQSWEGGLGFVHPQRACRQASYIPARLRSGTEYESQARAAADGRPYPKAGSGVGWRTNACPSPDPSQVGSRTWGWGRPTDQPAELAGLGQAGLGQTGRGPESPI